MRTLTTTAIFYNGKEIQTDLANQYDYGARFYDSVIGRWTTIDPMVEDGQEVATPHGYVWDDSVKFVDPDGKAPEEGGPNPASKILVGGLAIAGGTVAMAAPTVVGEAIALSVAAVEVTGTLLAAGEFGFGIALFIIVRIVSHPSHSQKLYKRKSPITNLNEMINILKKVT